ncbi:MAG: hypothetical protein AB7T37_15385 [Dehalococcoidia bacterium]
MNMTDSVLVPSVEPCAHRWRYFVEVRTQAVRSRKCERCGLEARIARPEAAVERRSA